ncbi:MAG TPA: methyltransferase domain-containing protein [Terracidiphilus sp.]|jgi:trans-aconitate methyltransferase
MPRSLPDFRRRAALTELMDEPCSREELRACLRDIAKVNHLLLGYRPLLVWLDSVLPAPAAPIRILDVGCGYGDALRRIAQWAQTRRIAVELIGLDVNPNAISIAAEATPTAADIEWVHSDVFAYKPRAPVHLVISSLFTHHLDDAEVVRFLAWMEQNATLGWLVNDLARGAIPYFAFRAFAKLANFHRFVQHDGPVSIARSFSPDDWRRLCAAAGLREGDIAIRAYKPARLCVERSKRP